MSSISTERKKFLHGAMSDLWQLIKDFDGMEDKDEYWIPFVKQVGVISKKYEQEKMIAKMCIAFLEAKEKEARAQKEKHAGV